MQAIATLVNATSDLTATEFWKVLTQSCDLNGIKIPQNPHFSWMVSEGFEEEAAKQAFEAISRKTTEFTVRTNGLGIFTGEKPILYLPIVKTEQLMDLHQEIWQVLFALGVNQNTFYHPSQWIPHVTVIGEEIPLTQFVCLVESIVNITLEMTIHVNNLALIYSNKDDAGIKFIQELGRGDQ